MDTSCGVQVGERGTRTASHWVVYGTKGQRPDDEAHELSVQLMLLHPTSILLNGRLS